MEKSIEEKYRLVNEFAKVELEVNLHDISHFKITGEIGKLIISLGLDHPIYKDIETFDIGLIDSILEGFFKSLSPDLLDTYLNIRREKDIKFVSSKDTLEKREFLENNYDSLNEEVRAKLKRDCETKYSGLDQDGILTIVLKGYLNDLFVTAHELFHKIFLQKIVDEDAFDNFIFLSEIVSVTVEVMLADYLIEKDLYKASALKYKYNTFKLLETIICRYLLELAFIEIYGKNGKITPQNLIKYIMSLEEPYQSKLLDNLEEVLSLVSSKGFNIWYHNRYIVAVFVSYYLKDKFKADVNSIFRLGINIYGNNLSEALKESEIDFIKITNIISRLLGNDKYKKNDLKIEEIFRAMKSDYQECVTQLNDTNLKR